VYRYEDRFDGVLLAHEVQVEGHKAKIMDGLIPYFGVPVHANMLLFSPQPGMILGRWTYSSEQLHSYDLIFAFFFKAPHICMLLIHQLYEIMRPLGYYIVCIV
jgi:hypothetical protein